MSPPCEGAKFQAGEPVREEEVITELAILSCDCGEFGKPTGIEGHPIKISMKALDKMRYKARASRHPLSPPSFPNPLPRASRPSLQLPRSHHAERVLCPHFLRRV